MSHNDVLRNVAGISAEFIARADRDTLVQALCEMRQAAIDALESVKPVAMTGCQLKVFELMLQGFTNKQIGQRMERAEKTVKAHVTMIFRLTGCRSRAEVIVKYFQIRGEQHAG